MKFLSQVSIFFICNYSLQLDMLIVFQNASFITCMIVIEVSCALLIFLVKTNLFGKMLYSGENQSAISYVASFIQVLTEHQVCITRYFTLQQVFYTYGDYSVKEIKHILEKNPVRFNFLNWLS